MASDYNGWPNRQTWNVMLWLDNEESAYLCYIERCKALQARGKAITGMRAKSIALDALGEYTPDGIKVSGSKVRWTAIAEAMRESL